jgi:hypothetical protein
MDNTTTPAPTAHFLTEAEVIAWLRDKAAQSGIPRLRLEIGTGPFPCYAGVDGCGECGFGDTFACAIVNFTAKYKTPEQRAAELRAQADAIIAQALIDQSNNAAA